MEFSFAVLVVIGITYWVILKAKPGVLPGSQPPGSAPHCGSSRRARKRDRHA